MTVPVQERDEDGYENMSAYFDKSSPQTAKKSTRKPQPRQQSFSPPNDDYDDQDDDDTGSREMDMDSGQFADSSSAFPARDQ